MRVLISLGLLACSPNSEAGMPPEVAAKLDPKLAPAPIPEPGPGQAVAVLAGGCFWCVEKDFDKLPGVVHTTSGYAGGTVLYPSYEDVTSETSGHQEAVHVVYDTAKLSYAQVLDYYWRHVDPTDGGGQFCDRGDSYRPVIFPVNAEQTREAEASLRGVEGLLKKPIKVTIEPNEKFWAAETYHQNFHVTNPGRYESYRAGCGRDWKVSSIWSGVP